MELAGVDAQRARAGARNAIWQLFASWTSGQAWPRMMPFAPPFSPTVHGNCFDLFAVDLIFSSAGSPYVMEVNQGPNLEVDGRYDVEAQLNESKFKHLAMKDSPPTSWCISETIEKNKQFQ
mgnify:CR=1 FL=1